MSEDLEIIKELEAEIGVKMNKVKEDETIPFYSYMADEEGRVIGLFLHYLKLPEFPPLILKLKNLVNLELLDNQLKNLPQGILELRNLKRLILWKNPFTSMPRHICTLKNLEGLWLAYTQIASLPKEIQQLENLKLLSLVGNKLTTFPEEILNLKDLNELRLGENKLTSISREIGQLANLEELDLSGNQLTRLPLEITRLKNLKKLQLDDNPLKQPPPEVAKQGIEAIFEYLRRLPAEKEKEEVRKVNEAKLILVGQGDVGKTCLAKRLKYDTFKEEKSTEGIDIFPWEIKAPTKEKEIIKLNTWDFGGQEIYHATHQFFLTKRSLYLLVWNARKSQDFEHIYYWLHTIEAFGGDSPIIMVMSKCKERDDDLNLKDLKQKFPQIIGLYKVDSKDATGIDQLKEIIRESAWKLPHMQTPWINSWFAVREQLEEDERDWIEYKEFAWICRDGGLDSMQTGILDSYLHDLGVIIHFKDKVELQNMVILKPEWATDAVYKILDTQAVRDRGGILLHKELAQIWDDTIYPPEIFPQLLKLMEKFELAYELPGKKSHLVAELLPRNEPEFDWDETENLVFLYCYDFLPAGVITRFIVRVHEDLEKDAKGKDLCWREGALLERENTRALVKVKPQEKRIEIRIKGMKKRELLAIIRCHIDHINTSIRKVKITKKIPCNCSPGCPYLWDYDDLVRGEEKNENEIKCMKSWNKTTISSLLDGYEKKEDRVKHGDDDFKHRPPYPDEERRFPASPNTSLTPTPVKIVEDKKKNKKWKTFWNVVVGIGVLLALVLAALELCDRLF